MRKERIFLILFLPIFLSAPLLCLDPGADPVPAAAVLSGTDPAPTPSGGKISGISEASGTSAAADTPAASVSPALSPEDLPDTVTVGDQTLPTGEVLVRMLSALPVRGYREEALRAAATVNTTRLLRAVADGTVGQLDLPDPQTSKKQWGDRWFAVYRTEMEQAVTDTWGIWLADGDGMPYDVRAFPLSWGKTEAGTVCPYDRTAEGFETDVTVTEEFRRIFPEYRTSLSVKNAPSGRVETVTSGGISLSGDEMRKKFSLPSPAFTVQITENAVILHCRGQGDGVGMSLYGANEDAKRGTTAEEILRRFFPDAQVVQWEMRSAGS